MMATVTVTQEDIDNGTRHDCDRCAVALSLGRVVQEGIAVQVNTGYAILRNQDGHLIEVVDLPLAGQRFVERFDAGLPVSPFSFEVDIDDDLLLTTPLVG